MGALVKLYLQRLKSVVQALGGTHLTRNQLVYFAVQTRGSMA